MRKLFRSAWKITQAFGVNPDYYKKFGLKGHEGVDLIPTGSVWDVLCLEDGVVVKDDDIAGEPKGDAYGIYATVWHPKINKATLYAHLKENYVSLGQLLSRGDKLGLMGKTGNTTGAHVHLNLFETDTSGIRLNKDNGYLGGIDPMPFLNEDPDQAAPDDDCEKTRAFLREKKVEFEKVESVARSWWDRLERANDFVVKVAKGLKTADPEHAKEDEILEELAKAMTELDRALGNDSKGKDVYDHVAAIVNDQVWNWPEEVPQLKDKLSRYIASIRTEQKVIEKEKLVGLYDASPGLLILTGLVRLFRKQRG